MYSEVFVFSSAGRKNNMRALKPPAASVVIFSFFSHGSVWNGYSHMSTPHDHSYHFTSNSMFKDRKKTLPLASPCQHLVVVCAIQGFRFFFYCAYISSIQLKKTKKTRVCIYTPWWKYYYLDLRSFSCFSVEPLVITTVFVPLWSCRDLSGMWIRRPLCRTSCPTQWERGSCVWCLSTGTPVAGWASDWRRTAAPTVSSTPLAVNNTLRKHSSLHINPLWFTPPRRICSFIHLALQLHSW